MTDDPEFGPADERDADAGEYVLGTLDAASRTAFERDLATDRALQASVYSWQDRLLPLATGVEPSAPDAGAWAALDARVAVLPGPATADMTPAHDRAANDPQWRRLRFWRAASALGLAASLMLATLLALRGPAGPSVDGSAAGPRYIAVLEAGDKSTGWVVEASAGGILRLVPVANRAVVPAGKTLQFWTKADGAAGPTSLGLVRTSAVVQLPVSALPTLEAHQLFELTLEPEAGSPTGRPTGPVVYVGRTLRL